MRDRLGSPHVTSGNVVGRVVAIGSVAVLAAMTSGGVACTRKPLRSDDASSAVVVDTTLRDADSGRASAEPAIAAGPSSSEPSLDAGAPAPVRGSSAAGLVTQQDPDVVACKTDDDCWLEYVDGGPIVAIPRPKKLRGKRVRPCSDDEHTPACRENVCRVLTWKC